MEESKLKNLQMIVDQIEQYTKPHGTHSHDDASNDFKGAIFDVDSTKPNANNFSDHGSPDLEADLIDAELFKKQDSWRTGEALNQHFSQVIKRYHYALYQRDCHITQLQEKLARYQNQYRNNFRTQPAIELERLHRTDAAVKVFQRDLNTVKTQLSNSPLEQYKNATTSSTDKTVIDELRRRENFGIITDLEKMGRTFLQKLKFEELLDQIHFKIEKERLKALKEQPSTSCTYNKEFEMLEITRNNLLKALRDLRTSAELETDTSSVQNRDNSIHTLYKPSRSMTSSVSVNHTTTHDSPDK